MHWSLYGVCSSPISPPELPEETKTDKRQFGHEGTPPHMKKWPKFTTWSETAYKPIYDVYMSSHADPGFNGYVVLYWTGRG